MQDLSGITIYTYDNAGRQKSVTNGFGQTLTYTYDAVGNRTKMVDSVVGQTNLYRYDIQNRITGITNSYGQITTIGYDALDRELTKIYGNSMVLTHAYDQAGRETARRYVSAAGNPIALYTGSYDAVGNRIGVQELGGVVCSYSYDPTYQLVNESRTVSFAYSVTYTYDGAGNRLTKVDGGLPTTYSYDAANGQVLIRPTGSQPTTNVYDANGNLTLSNAGGALTTLLWDSENRWTGGGFNAFYSSTLTLTYNADGKRMKSEVPTQTQYYLWDQENLLLESSNAVNTVGIKQTDYPGYWGGLVSQQSHAAGTYLVMDLSGNTREVLDPSGNVTDAFIYRAFGEKTVVTTLPELVLSAYGGQVGYINDSDLFSVPAVFGYLYSARARELNSTQGRWISRDPIGFDGEDWNLYLYVMNNPVAWLDPLGLRTITAPSRPTQNPPGNTDTDDPVPEPGPGGAGGNRPPQKGLGGGWFGGTCALFLWYILNCPLRNGGQSDCMPQPTGVYRKPIGGRPIRPPNPYRRKFPTRKPVKLPIGQPDPDSCGAWCGVQGSEFEGNIKNTNTVPAWCLSVIRVDDIVTSCIDACINACRQGKGRASWPPKGGPPCTLNAVKNLCRNKK